MNDNSPNEILEIGSADKIILPQSAIGRIVEKIKDFADLNLAAPEEKETELRTIHIPIIIFTELSERFGQGEFKKIATLGGDYQMQRIDSENPKLGFSGAIGLHFWEEEGKTLTATFALWDRVPKGKWNDIFEPKPVVELRGEILRGGSWSSGKGNLTRERITADFPLGGVNVNSATMRILSMILYRAYILTKEPNFKREDFWEADLFPGDYTEGED